jgi:aryl-phospho-beta-D-glucosidase BglC (GH1 family)
MLIGVNLSGAEFGDNFTGVYGVDYVYPSHADVDYFASKGLDVIRLPFIWERLQHTEFGPLNATELGRLDDVVNYATSKGLKVVFDVQDFGYGFNNLIGSAGTPNSAFADFWGKLAAHFKTNSNVIFGLMNEPHDQSASAWLASANSAIAAIRGAGATQEILVPGSYWDGAWTWTTTDNAAVIGTGVQDPLHNYAFEVHQYLDPDGGGELPGTSSTTLGVERLTAITQWAESTGNHLFLGEVGVSTDATSLTALNLMLDYMGQHSGVWQGVTYWSGGSSWPPDYMFSIEPQNGVDKPQMKILVDHLAAAGFSAQHAGTIVYTAEYGAAPSATELNILVGFTTSQYAYGQQIGVADPVVYAYQALGAALASTGTHFQSTFGPSNPAYPASTAGDAKFAADAYTSVFGHPGSPAQVQVFVNQVHFFEGLYTAAGVYGSASNIDLLARGAAYGQMLGLEAEITGGAGATGVQLTGAAAPDHVLL